LSWRGESSSAVWYFVSAEVLIKVLLDRLPP
jgi:hypothetical protein